MIYGKRGDFGRLMGRLRGYNVSALRHGACRTSEDAMAARLAGGWKDFSYSWMLEMLPRGHLKGFLYDVCMCMYKYNIFYSVNYVVYIQRP